MVNYCYVTSIKAFNYPGLVMWWAAGWTIQGLIPGIFLFTVIVFRRDLCSTWPYSFDNGSSVTGKGAAVLYCRIFG